MTILDTAPTPTLDVTVTHPAWCDDTRCTVLPDLPDGDGVHLSRTVHLDAAITAYGLLDVDVWLQQQTDHADVYLVVDVTQTGARALFPVRSAAVAAGTITHLLGLPGNPPAPGGVTYTHPDVLTTGVRDGWADPETDPTRIDWAPRQAAAAIGFELVDGRPVNPCDTPPIRYGRGELGHWGEALAADAIVTITDRHSHRWLLMIERGDSHGWALPGGMVEPQEDLGDAAVRELIEETGLDVGDAEWTPLPARYVEDPRGTCESWTLTAPSRVHLGTCDPADFPPVTGADDARHAAWVRADSYPQLVDDVATRYGGAVFHAHRALLTDVLGSQGTR